MKEKSESRYLRCDERAASIYSRSDEVDELALILSVDLTVELCKPVRVSLQGSKCLRMSVTHKKDKRPYVHIVQHQMLGLSFPSKMGYLHIN